MRTVAGGSNCQNGDRPSPGTAQVALLPLDPRSSGKVDSSQVWHSGVVINRRSIFKTLGFYSAKTGAPGRGTKSPRGSQLAGKGIPRHSSASQERKGSDLLG